MNFEWLLSPATQYCALALGLAGSLMLFVSTKMEIQSARREAQKSSESVGAGVTSLNAELQKIRAEVQELENTPTSAAPAEGLNLTKRAQVLRMHRRGEPIATIAAALRTPQNEVELLLKIQSLVSTPNP
jgi:F0F1-type ATP synthase membrane subunit b/b'